MTVNPHLYRKLPYDPVKDFRARHAGTSYMYVLVVPPAAPVKSLPDFIKLLQSKPGQMTYAFDRHRWRQPSVRELFN